jgi:predicted ribosomally synthesized peptide with nif11-like leader
MSQSDAEQFLERLETDQEFAARMNEVSGNPEATHQRAHDEGFEFTPEEMIDALGDRYGVELTPEQLDQIAAGGDTETIVAGVVGGTLLVGTLAAAAAGAAAIF